MENQGLTVASPDTMLQAAQAQQLNVERMTKLVGEMAKIVFTLEARLESLEGTMKNRVTVTYAQANALAEAVQERVKAICFDNSLPYGDAGKAFRAVLWREFYAEYGVKNRHDLPAMYFDNALSFIGGWSSYAALRRVRERIGL